jgi:hypothetical protein
LMACLQHQDYKVTCQEVSFHQQHEGNAILAIVGHHCLVKR